MIAGYLSDGHEAQNRLGLSLVSTDMHEHHGGTLTALKLHWSPSHRMEALISLVQRQHGLKEVKVREQDLGAILARGGGGNGAIRRMQAPFRVQDLRRGQEGRRVRGGRRGGLV